MRILLLTHSFNSLSQRLYEELASRGHDLSVELDINDRVAEEAVAAFGPEVVLAPFLKRAIPAAIWQRYLCLIVHPGVPGDRGPSALDWAILRGEAGWGVTVLQAEADMDAGPIWAAAFFPMRPATKASLYRNEVTEAAVRAVLAALERVPEWQAGRWQPTPLARVDGGRFVAEGEGVRAPESLSPSLSPKGREERRLSPPLMGEGPGERAGGAGAEDMDLRAPLVGGIPSGAFHPLMRQADRAVDWVRDGTATILTRIRAADGFPGVASELFGQPCRLFDAHAHPAVDRARPGEVLARRDGAVLRATVDGALWIGHVRRDDGPVPVKLPATVAFAEAAALPEWTAALWGRPEAEWAELHYREHGPVGTLSFDFYNGAMSTAQCRRLQAALAFARSRPTRVLVLTGGSDFWSNGIHLNTIEAAASPADESWANINAMNDVCLALLQMTDRLTVAALRGNAGAGGCFLALAADAVWAREGVILNPHYKNMGNLYGSEYWTYLLPRRVGAEAGARLMGDRLPLGARRAEALGLLDAVFGTDRAAFGAELARRAQALATAPDYAEQVAAKAASRAVDEATRPLAAYREAELAMMRRNFYGFDPSYHVARYHFVFKTPHSWTPRHLARHRDLGWVAPAIGSPA